MIKTVWVIKKDGKYYSSYKNLLARRDGKNNREYYDDPIAPICQGAFWSDKERAQKIVSWKGESVAKIEIKEVEK